jgi:hypothetical protein
MKRALCCLFLAAVSGCGIGVGVVNSRVSAEVSGRKLEAHADGHMLLASSSNRFELTLPRHTLALDQDQALLDGHKVALYPATTAVLRVEYVKRELTIDADANRVLRTHLP